ncbi:DUF6790 family protein [Xanthobacter sp. DSM 24535]|uniref:DUF6790 family protein n=1 Tax=Roseixanthobacter psychrophilus TaxID=3119917 RepID=UPI0037267569
MVFWVPLLSWTLALALAALAVARAPRPLPPGFVADRLMRYLFLLPVGLMGLWGALGHVFFASEAARAIGWEPSPFQSEVGMANLGIGMGGLIAAFYGNWGFRLGVAVVTAGFLGGAATVHLVQIVETGNLAAGNAGPILYTDILTPLTLLVLLALSRHTARA